MAAGPAAWSTTAARRPSSTPACAATATEHQAQCLATSRDDLLTWEKDPANPVLSQIPAEAGPTRDFRDPFVWREEETWFMVLASQVVGVGGAVFLYRSSDLHTWEYLHPLLIGKAAESGDVWECPNFFPFGDKWVLIVAGKGRNFPFTTFYFVGDYAAGRFTPEVEGVLDHGYFYAPLTMLDSRGRRLLWGRLREGRSEEAHAAAGWASMHAIPRVLSLRDGGLCMEPLRSRTPAGQPVDPRHFRLGGEEITLDVSGRAWISWPASSPRASWGWRSPARRRCGGDAHRLRPGAAGACRRSHTVQPAR